MGEIRALPGAEVEIEALAELLRWNQKALRQAPKGLAIGSRPERFQDGGGLVRAGGYAWTGLRRREGKTFKVLGVCGRT